MVINFINSKTYLRLNLLEVSFVCMGSQKKARFNVFLVGINPCDYLPCSACVTNLEGCKGKPAHGGWRELDVQYLNGGFVLKRVGVVIGNTFHSQLHDMFFHADPCIEQRFEVPLRHVESRSFALYDYIIFPYILEWCYWSWMNA